MDQAIRNKLRNVVTKCRKLLEDSVSQVLQGQFGIYAMKKTEVHIEDEARMAHLSDEDRECRKDIIEHFGHIKALGYNPQDALAQLIRETAFTHLNRLCAYKMMEAREVYVGGKPFREAVSRGLKSQGFLFYLADHPDDEQRYNSGQQDLAYRHFLDWIGGTLSEEIGVLFSPNDPANRLYPPQRVLDDIIDLLNDGDIRAEERDLRQAWPHVWSQDETIGWVYQYFTPKELRDKARRESTAPRNSYELAFRNQFFTPRYVVEFLTDNTLGRIWYEMRKGDTKLKDQCRYLVRRPNEVFLDKEQKQPENAEPSSDLSQDDLLKQPVYIPHRPKKDPRQLKILDPACGSGHFLLYCFDVLLTVYEEGFIDSDLGPALQQDYSTLDELRRDVPRLILAHNLHGIDIDLRASQIAALALWLRCQRAYQRMELKKDRPKITRSNLVCAEPMPGERQMLEEFSADLRPRVLGQLVQVVFDRMKLAGEAGSLLKIEDELRDAVAGAKKQWQQAPKEVQLTLFDGQKLPKKPKQQTLFDTSGITDAEFWDEAESNVLSSLQDYSTPATNGRALQRRLFADDAVRGFALIDICQSKFDAIVMNPPFGDPSKATRPYLRVTYKDHWTDLYSAFVVRATEMLRSGGIIGAITSRTFLALSTFEPLRKRFLEDGQLLGVAECGLGVLDEATVRAAFFTYAPGQFYLNSVLQFWDLRNTDDRKQVLLSAVRNPSCSSASIVHSEDLVRLPGKPFAYWLPVRLLKLLGDGPHLDHTRLRNVSHDSKPTVAVEAGVQTSDDFRFVRCHWEVPSTLLGRFGWTRFAHSAGFCRFYAPTYAVLKWFDGGKEILEQVDDKGNKKARLRCEDRFFAPGMVSPYISERGLGCSYYLPDHIHSNSCRAYFEPSLPVTTLLGYLNSSVADLVIWALTPDRKHEAGINARLPAPNELLEGIHAECEQLVPGCFDAMVCLRSADEADPLHRFSFDGMVEQQQNAATSLAANQTALDRAVERAFGFASGEATELFELSGAPHDLGTWSGLSTGDFLDTPEAMMEVSREFHSALLSHCVGVVFGRWDVRLSLQAEFHEPAIDPTKPLPLSPPAMLQDEHGMPLRGEPNGYPVKIDWDGILVSDAGHEDDVVRRVRGVLELKWHDTVETVERRIVESLKVDSLRDYFDKSTTGGFWDEHISRYSKIRRKAPIYWLLQSSKRNYALWIYYHRLDKDILFKALVNYVEPKIRLEESRLDPLRAQRQVAGASGKGLKKLEKDIDKQENLLSELRDFEEKLRRAADLHLEPDLNDGVVLNIAPLWELVPWKEAKKYWDELMKGKYEWSSIGKQLREKGLVK